MAKGKRTGKAYASGYSAYKNSNRLVKNKTAKLEKLLKENPNNKELEVALKNVRRRRNTPKTPYWSSSMIRIATVVKKFTGVFDRNYFSTDPDLFHAAICKINKNKIEGGTKIASPKGSMFSIGERIGWKF